MATLDITRFLDQPCKHYSGVRQQQGRLFTDADYNEGSRLSEEQQRLALLDIVGPKGSADEGFSIGEPVPAGGAADTPLLAPGASIPNVDLELNGVATQARPVSIRPGSYYVGGRRTVMRTPEPFIAQRDFLQMQVADLPEVVTNPGRDQVALEHTLGGTASQGGEVVLTLNVPAAQDYPGVVVLVATFSVVNTPDVTATIEFPDPDLENVEMVSAGQVLVQDTADGFLLVYAFVAGANEIPAERVADSLDVRVNGEDADIAVQAYSLRNMENDLELVELEDNEGDEGSALDVSLETGTFIVGMMGTSGGVSLQADSPLVSDAQQSIGGLNTVAAHLENAEPPVSVSMSAVGGGLPVNAANGLVMVGLMGVERDWPTFRTLYYLHSWDQCVTSLEDPEFRERALGNVETSARVRRMRRVEALGGLTPQEVDCNTAWRKLSRILNSPYATLDPKSGELRSRGRLQLQFLGTGESRDCEECEPDPARRFLGAANQTLRIMLTDPETFVWAFDNASTLYPVRVTGLSDPEADVVVEMLRAPDHESRWPLIGRVVEIIPFSALIEGDVQPDVDSPHDKKIAARVGAFSRVIRPFNPSSRSFTLDKDVGSQVGRGVAAMRNFVHQWDENHPQAGRLNITPTGDERYFYMRLWHEAPDASEVELRVEGAAQLRGTNVVPVFHRKGRRGDYWSAALRPETPDQVIPIALAKRSSGIAPHGPRDFYAPLAVLGGDDDTVLVNADCRPRIEALNDSGCVTFTVGDGVTSVGDFETIQEAVDAMPADGGTIVVQPGLYEGSIVIQSPLENLVIQGGGERTILRTALIDGAVPPEPEEGVSALITIDGAQNITLRDLSIQALRQRAIYASPGASGLSLSELGISAEVGRAPDGTPADSVEAPLIELEAVASAELRAIVCEARGRSALWLTNSQLVTAEELTLSGAQVTRRVPEDPMVRISGCDSIVVRDSILSTFGQIGVGFDAASAAQSRDIELTRLAVVAGSNSTRLKNRRRITSSRSCIDVENVERATVQQCALTMDETRTDDATLVVRGQSVTVQNNQLEVLSRCFDSPSPSPLSPGSCEDLRVEAWGGIHVRGDSSRITLRHNRLVGGVGHGITLGSFIFKASTNSNLKLRPGVGTGQIRARADGHRAVTGTIRRQFRAPDRTLYRSHSEGGLTDIVIEDNRIEQMSSNGISVPSVLAMPERDALVDIQGLVIRRNHIADNLRKPYGKVDTNQEVLPFPASLTGDGIALAVLPFGGVVLGNVAAADISDNVIINNSVEPELPINGIFILSGDAIVVSNNRIEHNGGRPQPDSPQRPPHAVRQGVRAGIAVMFAGAGVEVFGLAGSSLSILDELLRSHGEALNSQGSSLRVVGNKVIHPEGRALHAVASGPVVVSDNFLSSLGNHGSETLTDSFKVGEVVYIQNLGTPWETRVDESLPDEFFDTKYQTPALAQQYLDVVAATGTADERFFVGEGGRILFSNNQVSLDWEVLQVPRAGVRPPLSYFPVALLTLDHLSLRGNQFAFRLRGVRDRTMPPSTNPPLEEFPEPVLSHVFGVGATVHAGHNRSSESVGSSVLSFLGIAQLMNQAAFNQTTHELLTVNQSEPNPDEPDAPHTDLLTSPYTVRHGNQVLFQANYWNSGLVEGLRDFSARFLNLLSRPEQ